MKRDGFIGLFLLLALLAACTKVPEPEAVEPVETPSPELLAIDSLMWQQPDSALLALMAYEGDASEYNNQYAQLLTSELLYKNDYEQTNRPELQQAVAYFDSLLCQFPPLQRGLGGFKTRTNPIDQIAFLDARAHYINGVGYYERDSVIEACREYLKALEVMEGHFEEKELVGKKARFVALTYTHLAGLFSDVYLHEQAIYFGKTALVYYNKHDAPLWNVAWMLNLIGSHYDMMDELDSADYYYQKAVNYLPDTNNSMYRDITSIQAFLSYKKNRQTNKSLAILHRLRGLAMNDSELLSRNLVIGDILYYEQQFDSAWFYLKQVYDKTQSVDSKILAAERLQTISMYKGDSMEMKEYALVRSQYALLIDQNGKLHSVLSALCQQYEQNKQDVWHKLKVQKATKRWGIILSIVIVVIVVIFIFLTTSRVHNKKLRMERKEMDKLLQTERQTHKVQQAALSGRLKKSNADLRDISKQLEQTIVKTSSFELPPNDYSAFVGTPICLYIVSLAQTQQFKSKMDYLIYKDNALNTEQLLELRRAAEQHLARFLSYIRKRYPSLTDNDLDYCYLFMLGLNEADISALMQRAYTTVCDRSRKIKRIIGVNGDVFYALRNMLSE